MPTTVAETNALYVRLPRREAELLDRAAADARLSKRALVTILVQRHLGDEPDPAPLRVVGGEPGLGRHDFRPAGPEEVLTLERAAALLQVPEDALAELAEKGEVPGRRIAGEWRFSRAALLDWLAAGESASR